MNLWVASESGAPPDSINLTLPPNSFFTFRKSKLHRQNEPLFDFEVATKKKKTHNKSDVKESQAGPYALHRGES